LEIERENGEEGDTAKKCGRRKETLVPGVDGEEMETAVKIITWADTRKRGT
jgi:hypothetical protein